MSEPINIHVSIPSPDQHLVHVAIDVPDLAEEDHVDLALPVWTPGSYLVREYAQFVREVRVFDAQDRPLGTRKRDKATWRIDCSGADSVRVVYEVWAHELNVRYSHVDDSHAFLHGPSLFMHPVLARHSPIVLELTPPEGWEVHTGLRPSGPNTWRADDFDELYDCPLELLPSHAEKFEVEACGVSHRMVFWGRGNHDVEALRRDVPQIVEASASIFGGQVPYEDFLFVTLLTEDQYGGLEHRNSTALMYPRHRFQKAPLRAERPVTDDDYLDFLSLVAHEHFHVWNVKRIRPAALESVDYQRENYTRDLWTIEGVTSYYQWVSLLRAQIIDPPKFLEMFAKQIARLHAIPGRGRVSLEDASFDAWIKLYRPNPSNLNNDVSYYLKGAIVAMLLDLWMRDVTDGRRSLDDVMRYLWEHHGEVGYAEGAYEGIVRELSGQDPTAFFETLVRGTADPDYDAFLEPFGLRLEADETSKTRGWLGIARDGRKITAVAEGSPACGVLDPGDELVAIDGWRVRADDVEQQLERHTPDTPLVVHVFRRGELLRRELTPRESRPRVYRFVVREPSDERSRQLREDWLGTSTIGLNDDD